MDFECEQLFFGKGISGTAAPGERALACAISHGASREGEAWESLNELSELIEAAGGVCLRLLLQKREKPEASTFLGRGKLEEIKALAETLEVNLLVFDDELSGSQLGNIGELTGLRVIDRSLLILDIFARRAVTAEGKRQVELAQLELRLSRLTGLGQTLSRLGGGIGTRGPGESRLETDRRAIRRRVDSLKREIAAMAGRREQTAKRRGERAAAVAVVGYTNAGKSTLVNALCGADLGTLDQVFATLDPAARCLELPRGGELVLIDTVGFIRRLPTPLVDAFRSTLEAVCEADLILHLSDCADPTADAKRAVVDSVLCELGAADKPTMLLLNKIDLLPEGTPRPCRLHGREERDYLDILPLSLKTGEGLEALHQALQSWYDSRCERWSLELPYSEGALLAGLSREGRILSRESRESGIWVDCLLPPEKSGMLRRYLRERKAEA